MKKRDISKYTNKLIPQYLVQSFSVIIACVLGSYFMTWLVSDFMGVKGIYLGASLELIGTMLFLVVVLVPVNMFFYRRRAKEIKILSEGIKHLAEGDFDYKIPLKKRYALASVYENFNKMCEELKSVQILRNDFINSYSHEFKTPIASINGFAELLLDKTITELEREEYLKIIIEETSRLSKLATNTILLSRLSTQKIVTDMEEYDLSEQIRQCSIILSKRWLEKGIEFTCALPSVVYKGNRELMQHLWLNLISNAIEHTPKGGEIAISLEEKENEIILNIADSGEGMDAETLKNVFEPYFQGDASRSSKGLGLGLAIAKRICELCGGSIKAESAVGEGSLFTITLGKLNVNKNGV